MASLVAKKKGNKLYYYVVESARVEGKPRIVHQAYLGTAEQESTLYRVIHKVDEENLQNYSARNDLAMLLGLLLEGSQ